MRPNALPSEKLTLAGGGGQGLLCDPGLRGSAWTTKIEGTCPLRREGRHARTPEQPAVAWPCHAPRPVAISARAWVKSHYRRGDGVGLASSAQFAFWTTRGLLNKKPTAGRTQSLATDRGEDVKQTAYPLSLSLGVGISPPQNAFRGVAVLGLISPVVLNPVIRPLNVYEVEYDPQHPRPGSVKEIGGPPN